MYFPQKEIYIFAVVAAKRNMQDANKFILKVIFSTKSNYPEKSVKRFYNESKFAPIEGKQNKQKPIKI